MRLRATVLCALALLACAYARTATRAPAISAHITSLTDKDARTKAMTHPAFANAGRQAGLEIWRIEDFEPVPVPARDYGKFYKGDSYIVLKTSADKKGNLAWDIHYWIGSESTQDESGAAAILTVGLDDKFNGAAIQHRETMGHESTQFQGYFSPAIRYMDGGHASGFHHVTTNAGAEKRLFQIKGKRNVRVRQVDPVISSMNKGDVFILDKDHDIYVYVGDRAKNVERLKAISVANQIRDQDHNGRARVEIIDQYSSEVDVEKFFTALGSGSRQLVPEESAGGDDQQFEKSEEQTVTLSEISDSSGKIKITPLSRPYRQEQLKPQEVYILDTVSGSIYVWVGKQSTDKEKSEAMTKAQEYLSAKQYPSWVHISRIPQGTEPAVFKQYFQTWRDVGASHSRIVRSASDEDLYPSDDEVSQQRARQIGKSGVARTFMPDDAGGSYIVYRIENMQPVKAYDSSSPGTEMGKRFGEFFQGDSYIIQYTGKNNENPLIYMWLGKDSSVDEQAAAAINAVFIDNTGKATLIRVPQGEEPKHLLQIFHGRLVTLAGGRASGFKNANHRDTYDTDGIRLFRVFGSGDAAMRAEQVAEVASSLRSDDVFLLETPGKVYVWHGAASSAEEQLEAAGFARRILGDQVALQVLREGQEPPHFWSVLNGDASQVSPAPEWRALVGHQGALPQMYEATVGNDNRVYFDAHTEFKQSALNSDEVWIVDAADVFYVWEGTQAPDAARKSLLRIAQAFQSVRPRGPAAAILIKQGMEPTAFTNLFEAWDPHMWLKQDQYEEARDRELAENEIDTNK